MSANRYLLSVLLNWFTAIAGLLLIKHGLLLIAFFLLIFYCCFVLLTAFHLDEREHSQPYRLVGAHEKRGVYEDCH